MGHGSENVVLTSVPAAQAATTVSPPENGLPVRNYVLKVLRFVSVLVGAGLLLRTASAEYVVSAPQQEPSRQPNAQPKARLAVAGAVQASMPKPAFGNSASDNTAFRDAAPGRLAAPGAAAPDKARKAARGRSGTGSKRVRDAATVAGLQTASTGAPYSSDRAFAEGKAAPLAFAAQPVAAAPSVKRSLPALSPPISAPAEPALASPRAQPGATLLAPVRIVSGAAPVRKADGVSAPQPVGIPPAQISLAPPVMRPGPRKTELTTDVSTAMRRAASAWDYAEALPPELMGRSAQAPRPSALPKAVVSAAPALAPNAASSTATSSAGPERTAPKPVALAPAHSEPGRLAPSAPAAAAPASAPLPRDETPRPLAMLDRPASFVPARPAAPRRTRADAGVALAPEHAGRKERLARAASPRQLADERRTRRDGTDAGALPMIGAAPPEGEGSTVAAEGTVLSLRDRMPHPAF